jgi:glycosyltransferase involved in cell wall biosynthesis
MSVWLLVAGDFTTWGGMDSANHALACYLARQAQSGGNGAGEPEVHLVSHRVAPALASMTAVRVHQVARPFGAERFGEPLIRRTARVWQRRLAGPRLRSIANGGNFDAGDVNWVHYVHAAFATDAAGPFNRLRIRSNHRRYAAREREALRRARVVICNSKRTARDVERAVGVEPARVHVVYYGVDAERFGPADAAERRAARESLGLADGRPLALFVGALGDRRKGFDIVFESWRTLCAGPHWDVDLVVAGAGAELPAWRARAAAQLPRGRMTFLGFRRDMPAVFAACDLLIHPARYEAYGLAAHEALCRGLPAMVPASAGVAERYPADLAELLLYDPESASELAGRLTAWRADEGLSRRAAVFGSRLRARSWDHMAREIVSLIDGGGV